MNNLQNEELLIQENIGLVIHIAQSFKPRNPLELDEYVQLGRIGLLKAIRNYDSSKAALTTFAWYYISGEIKRYLQSEKRFSSKHLCTDAYDTESTPQLNVEDYLPSCLTTTEKFIVLKRLEKYSFREIGNLLGGKPRGWTDKQYHKAVKKIKDYYEEENIVCK